MRRGKGALAAVVWPPQRCAAPLQTQVMCACGSLSNRFRASLGRLPTSTAALPPLRRSVNDGWLSSRILAINGKVRVEG